MTTIKIYGPVSSSKKQTSIKDLLKINPKILNRKAKIKVLSSPRRKRKVNSLPPKVEKTLMEKYNDILDEIEGKQKCSHKFEDVFGRIICIHCKIEDTKKNFSGGRLTNNFIKFYNSF